MSENYGDSQPKVVETEGRSWANSVQLNSRPALSSDLNLIGQISEQKDRENFRATTASGFLRKGEIRYSEDLDSLKSSANSGDILTSEELTNSFFLASNGKDNLAVVNGWLINLSATGSPTGEDHNLILLGNKDNSSSFTDFVFLEVWKEMVSYQDVIKKNGNQTSYVSLNNDIEGREDGLEYSKRVQVKYRVRVESDFSVDLSASPDGFNSSVFARGGANSVTSKNFSHMGSMGDPGLYRAGNGSKFDQEILNTVDGYVYAIPMFIISRRKGVDNFNIDNISNMYNAGVKEDGNAKRPDNLYADVVYPQDIVDIRRKVYTGDVSLDTLAERTLRSVAKGTYRETKGKIRFSSGGYGEAPGGTVCIRSESVSSTVSEASAGLVSGSPRRSFCNARVEQKGNIRKVEPTDWDTSSEVFIDLSDFENYTYDFIGIYSDSGWVNPASYLYELEDNGFTIAASSVPTEDWYVMYDVETSANKDFGYHDVPSKFLEQRYGSHLNGEIGNNVNLYGRDASFGINDVVSLLGHQLKDISNMGQVAFVDAVEDGVSGTSYLDFPGMSMPGTGQQVMGVRSVQRYKSDGSLTDYLPNISFTVGSSTLTVNGITAAASGETSNLRISLYLGTKFWENNKEAKGIINTMELSFVDVNNPTGDTYTFDTHDIAVGSDLKAIVNVCGILTGPVESPAYTPYVLMRNSASDPYESSRVNSLYSKIAERPILDYPNSPDNNNTPTKCTWDESSTSLDSDVKIGVFTLSWIDQNDELCSSIYNTRGYQGFLIDSQKDVDILCEGPALVTTKGSGEVHNFTTLVSEATVETEGNAKIVKIYKGNTGIDFGYGQIQEGDYLKFSLSSKDSFRVSKVESDSDGDGSFTKVTLFDSYANINGDHEDIYFTRLDTSFDMFTNLVGRFPSREEDDFIYSGGSLSGQINTVYSKPVSSAVDALSTGEHGAIVGEGEVYLRGKADLTANLVNGSEYPVKGTGKVHTYYLPVEGGNDLKVFQSYVVREKSTGRNFLAVVSSDSTSPASIGSLTQPMTSPFKGRDAVDLYELDGRVLLKA